MAPLDGQLSGRPVRVRNHEVQELPLAVPGLLGEELGGLPAQGEEHHALLHVGLVRLLVAEDRAAELPLLRPPLAGLALEERGVDEPVELVGVGLVDARLELGALVFEAGHRVLVVGLGVVEAVAQALDEPGHHLVVEVQAAQRGGEVLGQDLLAQVGLAAGALEAGAVVVDVLALLPLGRQGAAAVPAADEAGEGPLVDPLVVALVLVAAVEHLLDPLEERRRDQGLVDAAVGLALPDDVAHVDGVVQDPVDRGAVDLAVGALHPQAGVVHELGEVGERGVAGGSPLEQLGDDRPADGIHLHDLLAVVAADVEVADGRAAGPEALGRLLAHALAGLLRQVVDVVLGHQHADAVHELVGRPRVVGEDHALLHEVDLELHPVEVHPVLEVAVEPVGLLDEDDVARLLVPLEPRDHAVVVRAAGALGGLDVDVLLDDLQPVVLGVALEQALLGRDGEALALLVLRGHARVGHAGAACGALGGLGLGGAGGAAVGAARGGIARHDDHPVREGNRGGTSPR